MKADYVHKDSMTLEEKPQVFTRWIDQTIMELKQENQELKLELSGYRQAILEDKDMLGLKEESKELKNQLEGKNNPQIFIDTQDMEERYGEQLYQDYLEEENKKYKNQQKEFINYLESWKGNEEYCYLASNPIDRCRKDIYEEILQKYKEIIGVSDEKEN